MSPTERAYAVLLRGAVSLPAETNAWPCHLQGAYLGSSNVAEDGTCRFDGVEAGQYTVTVHDSKFVTTVTGDTEPAIRFATVVIDAPALGKLAVDLAFR